MIRTLPPGITISQERLVALCGLGRYRFERDRPIRNRVLAAIFDKLLEADAGQPPAWQEIAAALLARPAGPTWPALTKSRLARYRSLLLQARVLAPAPPFEAGATTRLALDLPRPRKLADFIAAYEGACLHKFFRRFERWPGVAEAGALLGVDPVSAEARTYLGRLLHHLGSEEARRAAGGMPPRRPGASPLRRHSCGAALLTGS